MAFQEIEVVRFFGSFHLSLFLNYVASQAGKSNLSKNYYQIWSTDFQNKKQISYHHENYFLH